MAELPSPAQSSNAGDDNLPIALRRVRRSCSNFNLNKAADNTKVSSSRATGAYGLDTPPATPRRTKRVRFSDPGSILASASANASSGLTPFISRHSISSPRTQRRHSSGSVASRSTSSKSRWNLDIDDSPISGTLQFAPLRQVLEGRVKRRIRRNRLSEELNSVEFEKREEKRAQSVKILQLQEELRVKDFELQALREDLQASEQLGGAPATPESQAQAEQLERSISELQSELNRSFNEHQNASPVGPDESAANWTLTAKDPWDEDAFMADMDTLQEDSEVVASTPHRRMEQMRRSFPSPPDTASNTPSRGPQAHVFRPITPSSLRANNQNPNRNLGVSTTFANSLNASHTGDTTIPNSPALSATTEAATEFADEDQDHCVQLLQFQPPNYTTTSTGIQTSFSLLSSLPPPHPSTNFVLRKEKLVDAKAQAQIYDLTEELATLTETLEYNTTTQERLAGKLEPWVSPVDASHTVALDFALDSVLTHLALAQESAHDHETRFDALITELCGLFPATVEEGEKGEHDHSGAKAEAVLNLLRDQFRAARLDLEYLFPGEQAEGFDNTKLLWMLIDRLKTSNSQTISQKAQIEAFTEQESSLKTQLNARVDAMTILQGMVAEAQKSVAKLEEENNKLLEEGCEKDTSFDRLKSALESYRTEVAGLEACINKLDDERTHIIAEGRRQLDEMRTAAHDRIGQEIETSSSLRAQTESQARIISDLEARLASASAASKFLQSELQRLTSTPKDGPTLEQLNLFRDKAYSAITERDSTISSMHAELQTLTTALATSQEEISRLRDGLSRAHESIAAEKLKGRQAMERMKSEMRRVLEDARIQSNNSTPVREIVARVPSTGFLRGVAMAQEVNNNTVAVNEDMNVDTSMHDDAGQSMETKRLAPTLVETVSVEAKVEVGHRFDKHLSRRRRSKAVGEDERREEGVRKKRRQTFGVGGRE